VALRGMQLHRSCTEAAQKLHRSCTEAARKLHRSCTEAARKLHGSCTEAAQKLRRSCTTPAVKCVPPPWRHRPGTTCKRCRQAMAPGVRSSQPPARIGRMATSVECEGGAVAMRLARLRSAAAALTTTGRVRSLTDVAPQVSNTTGGPTGKPYPRGMVAHMREFTQSPGKRDPC
jgi:hypothetical protein